VTETNYFRAFPVPSEVHVSVHGKGYNTTSLVAQAEKLAKVGAKGGSYFDQVWVVYDKDDFSAQQFNEAAASIGAMNSTRPEVWRAAWSNQSFELWYLLHFQYSESALHRDVVAAKLSEVLSRAGLRARYQKNDPDMYSLLSSRQPVGIRHAQKLKQLHAALLDATPALAAPCTLVVDLVEALNAEIR
jgi:hypothetical protein